MAQLGEGAPLSAMPVAVAMVGIVVPATRVMAMMAKVAIIATQARVAVAMAMSMMGNYAKN